jgi:hypothetical protein
VQVPADLTTEEKTEAIRKLYEILPKMECKGLCVGSCTDIDMSSHERWLIEQRHQIKIKTRDFGTIIRTGPKVCRALSKDGRCKVYEDRPLICRAWGAIEPAPCPFGCKVDRLLSDEEYKALELLVEDIGGHHIRTPEDRRRILRSLSTATGKAALKRQYDTARAETLRLASGGENANASDANIPGEPVD